MLLKAIIWLFKLFFIFQRGGFGGIGRGRGGPPAASGGFGAPPASGGFGAPPS